MSDEYLLKNKEIFCEELGKSRFSLGDLYLLRSSGKKLRLLKFGDIADHKFINKFKEAKGKVVLDRMVNNKWIDGISNLFLDMQNSRLHVDNEKIRLEILKEFKKIYWEGIAPGSVVDLFIAGERAFYSFDDELTALLQESNSVYYQRSALKGFLAVISALLMGYVDYKFLRDVYHICYLFDYVFFKKHGLTYNITQAQEMERITQDSGFYLLAKQFESKNELEMFQDHLELGTILASGDCGKYFYNKSIINLINYHHEKIDGSGFARGANHSEVSDIELIIMALGQMISYDFMDLTFDDGKCFFKNMISLHTIENECSINRYFMMVQKIFNEINIEQKTDDEVGEDLVA